MKANVIESIAKAVADYYGMEASMLFQNTRRRDVTDKRAIFHFLCHKHTDLSLQQIGRFAENYNRTAQYKKVP
jgi:chromosomal replication initiation ATPase DnaA